MVSTPQNLRLFCLVILSLQTSAFVLLLRYSRTSHSQHYVISTAVLLAETLKFLLSLLLLLAENGYAPKVLLAKLKVEVLLNLGDTLKLALPAGLYVVQNNLLFVALTNLDAATYQVTYQLKILTTALFSWLLLGRRLSFFHWISLALLMIGVSLVQIDETVVPSPITASEQHTQTDIEVVFSKETLEGAHPNKEVSWLLGILAVFVSCLSSGFSGVYFERLVKQGKNVSLLIKNVQLGIFSLIFSSLTVYGDRHDLIAGGFFQGYRLSTWGVIVMQAFGGLIVSFTMKHADNILKGFATSVSIILSTLISWALLGDRAPSLQFVVGASIVIASTFLYGMVSSSSSPAWSGDRGKAGAERGSSYLGRHNGTSDQETLLKV